MGADLALGEIVDSGSHERTGEALLHDADDLTTHGVIVGMTGSGKTGLGVVLLEEALRAGIPTLVLDPKGDMTNLALRFPGLSAPEFAPWVPTDSDPEAVASTWRDGLASWGLDGTHVAELAAGSKVTVYTPGSTAGTPVNLIGSLAAPASTDAEATADEVDGLVTGLLSLVGITADPLSSREHILLTNLVSRAWGEGADLDLATLVHQVQDPPLRKLGVLELDSFYPAADRTQLALKLNGLLASPSFASWAEGPPLDIGAMLTADGGTACPVIYLAHLTEEERQFVVTLVLSKLITWMRSQSGTPNLRALVYMDEVYGYVPPSAMPPAKKPILTLLKQARAYGVGVVLSTQNPVDLDYKAIANAGTWMIGRLQTERDVARLEEGLAASSGAVDVASIKATIAGLAKREFVVHTTDGSEPRVFTSRWALDYLAGPLTRDQIPDLPGQSAPAPVTGVGSSTSPTEAPSAAPVVPPAEPAAATPPVAPHATAAPVPDQAAPATRAPAPADPVAPSTEPVGTSAIPPAPTLEPAVELPHSAAPVAAEDEVAVPPKVADGVVVRWVDPAAPWLAEVGAGANTPSLTAGIAARINVVFDDTKADLRHVEEYELVVVGLSDPFDADAMIAVDYDDRDLREAAPPQALFRLPDAPVGTAAWFRKVETAVKDRIHREEVLTLGVNRKLKLYSRPGESTEEFLVRCHLAADEGADAEAAKIRARLEKRMSTVNRAIEREQIRVDELKTREADSKRHEMLAGAGDVLGSLLGGRRSTKSILGKVTGVSSRRRSSSAAAARVDTALAKVDQKEIELVDLEAELAEALADIAAEWDAVAEEVEDLEVTLEKNDITVSQLALVWL